MGSRGSRSNSNGNNKTMMSNDGGYHRRAQHAGSWYSNDPETLEATLTGYMAKAAAELEEEEGEAQKRVSSSSPSSLLFESGGGRPPPLRAIICPHAGYSYSGPTAAFSYYHLQNELSTRSDCPIRHILVFHPSHHHYLDGCAVSGARTLETPLGDLPVDDELRHEILALKSQYCRFSMMEQDVDEAEHSGEMQYPYIALAQKNRGSNSRCETGGGGGVGTAAPTDPIPVLPIMCGSINFEQETEFGRLLAPIVGRPDVLSIVSTDFMHWGRRFQYQPTQPTNTATTHMEIFEYIQQTDQEGMTHIELQEPGAFAKYLKRTRNTICGRHAIQTWLSAVVHNSNIEDGGGEVLDVQFVKYAQSSKVKSMRDSSVSYASATARTKG